ncbi:MAG: DUF3365 domain-containing protein [Armatimonadota bacterium]
MTSPLTLAPGRLTLVALTGACLLFPAGLAAAGSSAPAKAAPPPSLAEAKRLVRMMDDIYQAGVLSAHKMYVQEPGVPAAVTWAKQVIGQVKEKGWPEARIFATTDRILNPENKIETAFEREAAAAFRKGMPRFEKIDGDVLRYATEIRVVDQACISCHNKEKIGDLLGGVSYQIRFAQEGKPKAQR